MTGRAIPGERPAILTEIATPSWSHPVGAEPAFVHGRLLVWGRLPDERRGRPALLELDPAGGWHELFTFDAGHTNAGASRPVAVDGLGIGFAWDVADDDVHAVIIDDAGTVRARTTLPRASTGSSLDFVVRAAAGALVVGWSGLRAGERAAGSVSLDAAGERWRMGELLLGASPDLAFLSPPDAWMAGVQAIEARSGRPLWKRDAPAENMVRGAVGVGDGAFYVIEQPPRAARGDRLVAIDAARGEARWTQTFDGGRIAAMRVRGRAIALVQRRAGEVRTFVLNDAGTVLDERDRDTAAFQRFEIAAIDHTHVLWVDDRKLIAERIATGERVWDLELPEPFQRHQAIRIACADGRIAIRHHERLWLFG